MEKDILTAIVCVEKEIRGRLVAERCSAEERLEALQGDLAGELAREEERLGRDLENALAAAGEEAKKRAAALVEAATVRAARLAGLEDGALQRLLERHLAWIAPGGNDDSPDVQD